MNKRSSSCLTLFIFASAFTVLQVIGLSSLSVNAYAQGKKQIDDWAQFRGTGGSGISTARNLPERWSDTDNIVWKTRLSGAGTSSPVIIGDRIFLTCYRGYSVAGETPGEMEDLRLDVICLSRTKGNILWTKSIKPDFPEQPTIRDEHGYSSSTPAADKDRVYVFLGKTGVFAFDYDGNQVWHRQVGSQLNGWGSAASPVLYENLLLVNASVESESLVALDKKTGKEKWRVNGIKEAWNTPLLMKNMSGETELIVPIVQKIRSFSPKTGRELWTCDTGINWYMVPSAVANQGIVYCIGGRSGDSLAIKTGGIGDITQTHLLWKLNKGSNVSSPIFYQGYLYWMHEKLGIAYCVDASTGKVIYEERIPRAGQIYAAPVLADGKLYYLSRNGRTFVIDAVPQFRLLATNQLEERGRFDASPAVADNKLFIRSNKYLYCIGKE
ncbi:MAG: PQQ-binding-like beta-propeller repeat protein [Planctomycetaceae bacterium]|nr:PQQ-binding-like beta-propeller repeat protein [Planctomycetaceae bacterium]